MRDDVPICFGLYKDNRRYCLECKSRDDCVEELVCSIVEGRSRRPSAVVTLKELLEE